MDASDNVGNDYRVQIHKEMHTAFLKETGLTSWEEARLKFPSGRRLLQTSRIIIIIILL